MCGAEAEALLRVHGRNELEEKTTPKWLIFLKLVRLQGRFMRWCLLLNSSCNLICSCNLTMHQDYFQQLSVHVAKCMGVCACS